MVSRCTVVKFGGRRFGFTASPVNITHGEIRGGRLIRSGPLNLFKGYPKTNPVHQRFHIYINNLRDAMGRFIVTSHMCREHTFQWGRELPHGPCGRRTNSNALGSGQTTNGKIVRTFDTRSVTICFGSGRTRFR